MGAGDAASGGHQAVHPLGHKAAVGQVIGDHILDLLLRLSGPGGVVDVHDELRLVDHHVVKPLARGQLLGGDEVLPHHPAALPDPGGGAGGDVLAVLVSGQVLPEKADQRVDLSPQGQLGGIQVLYFGAVHAVGLGGVHLPLPLVHCGVQPHGGQVLRQHALLGALLAVVQEPLAVERHVVHVADADNAPVLVHVVQGELQGHGLHEPVLPALLDLAAGEGGHVPVAGGVHHHLALQGQQPLLGGDHHAGDPVVLHQGVGRHGLEVDLDVLVVDELRQHGLGPLHVVGHAHPSDHIVVRHLQQGHQLVPHGPLAHHAQDGAHVAAGQVAAGHAVALQQRHLGALPGGGHGRADPGGARAADNHIKALVNRDLSGIGNGLH